MVGLSSQILSLTGGVFMMLVNIKAALAAHRLRQWDLAAMLKISQTTMSEIIAGRRPVEPRMKARIAEILRTNEDWLFQSTVIPAPRTNSEQHITK
jgi:transcriptional regulator with XRE-family HTH domain